MQDINIKVFFSFIFLFLSLSLFSLSLWSFAFNNAQHRCYIWRNCQYRTQLQLHCLNNDKITFVIRALITDHCIYTYK